MTPPRDERTLSRIEFLVLSVLVEGARHGYGIAQEIDRRTSGEIAPRPGSLYRVLDRLTRRMLVEPTRDTPADASTSTDVRRAYYALTEEGRTAVRTEAALLESLARRVLSEGEGHA